MQYNSFYSKYNYIRKLGHGGCGEVFLAENKALKNFWAIKEIQKDKKTSISGYIEPEILKRLNHPALPRICDVYEDDEKIYIIEDYIEGTSLIEELRKKGKFEEQRVVDWAIQLCSVLEYLHMQKPNPIVYGDLKPHNIILTEEGFVKLIDFGVSTFISGESNEANKSHTTFIGTRGYSAPEQFMGEAVSYTSDIFSLGITLIQLLTGIDPINSTSQINNNQYKKFLSDELFQILQKCIQHKPQLRYQSAAELKKELQNYGRNISNLHENPEKRIRHKNFSKLIAITGARGTGVSTITAALAEKATGAQVTACIADLSATASLAKGVKQQEASDSVIKINRFLSYINLTSLINPNSSEQFQFERHLAQLHGQFTYIFIEVDITRLKYIEKYMDKLFIVTDMNPENISRIGMYMDKVEMAANLLSRAVFIINKFYSGELASRTILKSLVLDKYISQQLQELIMEAQIYEVPYDQNVYLKWMYSCFEEEMNYGSLLTKPLIRAISRVISKELTPK